MRGLSKAARRQLLTPPKRPTGNRAIGKRLAAAHGWTGVQWVCLNTLWMHESGWNHRAQNPTSSAYGVSQFLDGTWGRYGRKTSNPSKQITYGLAYIHDRYGTPCSAWTFWWAQKSISGHNWY